MYCAMVYPLLMQWTTVTTCIPSDTNSRCHAAVHKNHLYIAVCNQSQGSFVLRVSETNFEDAERLTAPPDTDYCAGILSHNDRLFFVSDPTRARDPDEHPVLFQLEEISAGNGTHRQGQGTWRRLRNARCPLRQRFPAFFGMGDSLVIVGGKNHNSLTTVTEYNLLSCDWNTNTRWPPLRTAAQQQQPVVLNSYTHLFGGLVMSGSTVTKRIDSVVSLEMKTGRPSGDWSERVFPTTPNACSEACRLFQTVVLAGGKRSENFHPGVFVLDSTERQWLQLPSLRTARTQTSLVVYRGSLYAIGGGGAKGWLPTVERLDLF